MIIIYRESVVCYKNESLCKFYLALYLLCFYLFIHYTYKYYTIRNPNLIFKIGFKVVCCTWVTEILLSNFDEFSWSHHFGHKVMKPTDFYRNMIKVL